ncbi:MAG: MoaD/ThiS family protein [Actinobacteria bacterium]|nr:MoaD/ThiS family protein [Actinomycetota bacterium]MBI3688503.1 MoaD/ThiS family protein [Actinomycetota bacterium]
MVTVRYWAGAKEAAGRSEEQVAAGTIPELVAMLTSRGRLAEVLPACSLLMDGQAVRPTDGAPIPAAAVVDVLPPFAGG